MHQCLPLGGVIVLLAYVDDIIAFENDEKEDDALKNCMRMKFEITDLERLKYFLRRSSTFLARYIHFPTKVKLL